MYVSAETIANLEKKYGQPEELSFAYEMTGLEFGVVRGSQKHGRAHDATLFIIKEGQIVVIKKPMYPPGAYRAPSGGIAPGEPFEEGALREAYEETGLVVSLQKYILRAKVRFSHGSDAINWTSHVFTASSLGAILQTCRTARK